jgi:nifR3 family TIM-barrel protein
VTNLTPFFIDSIKVDPPLVMAPLHEITDSFFRCMIWQIGGVGLTVSEMISSEALIRNVCKAKVMMLKTDGAPYAIQLSGNNPESLGIAARIAKEAGANIIDLNMGCPASNVTSNGSGSALLKDILSAESCITAMIKSVTIPVTVKMRTGWDDSKTNRTGYLEFLKMFEAAGVKAVAIHPRTRAQQYKGNADWSLIRRAVDTGTKLPIIGNGDITNPVSAKLMLEETGCAGIMIGRAALTNPWIFQQTINPNLTVTETQRIDLCIDFFHMLLESLAPLEALHKMKKIGSWFTKGIHNGASFRQELNTCNSSEMIFAAMERLKIT